MAANPAAWNGVKRATYAYHMNHREPSAHYFAGSQRDAACRWCGRSREFVRHGDGPPQCSMRPAWADESIESVIAKEEALFAKTEERAFKLAATLDFEAVSGDELSRIHHTSGVDPSMLEGASGRIFPPGTMDAYMEAYSRHRQTGERGLKREIIVAKTASTP